jgi:hypothetical protein
MVEKATHAPGLRTLNRYQLHMTPDVIAMAENRELGFIAICVLLQTFDAFLNQAPEPGTDVESFARIWGSVFQRHCKLHGGERLKRIVNSSHLRHSR